MDELPEELRQFEAQQRQLAQSWKECLVLNGIWAGCISVTALGILAPHRGSLLSREHPVLTELGELLIWLGGPAALVFTVPALISWTQPFRIRWRCRRRARSRPPTGRPDTT